MANRKKQAPRAERRRQRRLVKKDASVATPARPARPSRPGRPARTPSIAPGAPWLTERLASLAAPPLPRRQTLLIMLALCVLVAVGYFPATYGGLIWDDFILTASPPVHEWSGIFDLWFDPPSMRNYEGHYWPVLYTIFWLEHKIWGLNPIGYHLNNMILHAGVVVVLWQLLRRLGVPGALFAAAIFAVHPQHVESVVWIIGRKDVLATLFCLGAVFTYVRFIEHGRRSQYVWALALFTLGLLSKSTIVTLPAGLLIWHWWRQGRVSTAAMTSTLPFFMVGLGIALADTAYYQSNEHVDFGYSLLERVVLAAHVLGFYVGKLLWPAELAVIYPKWQIGVGDWVGWACALGGAATAALLWRFRATIGRGPLAGVLFFAVTLSPSLGFVDYGYMQYSFVADRYQYFASIGLVAVFAAAATVALRYGLARLAEARRRPARLVAGGGAAALVALLATLAWQQATIYEDEHLFYSHIVSYNPVARSAHHNRGLWLHKQGRSEEALADFHRELQNRPDYDNPHVSIGIIHDQANRFVEAEKHYRNALRIKPHNKEALNNLPLLLVRRGQGEEQQGRIKEAEALYQQALQVVPHHADATLFLGALLGTTGRYQASATLFQDFLKVTPDSAIMHGNLGLTLFQLKRFDAALRSFDRALELDPNMEDMRTNRERLVEFMASGEAGGQ